MTKLGCKFCTRFAIGKQLLVELVRCKEIRSAQL